VVRRVLTRVNPAATGGRRVWRDSVGAGSGEVWAR